jgi:hypothetical protein
MKIRSLFPLVLTLLSLPALADPMVECRVMEEQTMFPEPKAISTFRFDAQEFNVFQRVRSSDGVSYVVRGMFKGASGGTIEPADTSPRIGGAHIALARANGGMSSDFLLSKILDPSKPSIAQSMPIVEPNANLWLECERLLIRGHNT